jgi:hypothetical protein
MKRTVLAHCFLPFLLISCLPPKKPRFEVRSPAGWERTDTVTETGAPIVTMRYPRKSDPSRVGENIIITVERSGDAKKYMYAVNAQLQTKSTSFREIASGTIIIDRHSAYWEQYAITYKKTNYPAEQKIYFVEDGGNVYTISCSTHIGKIPAMQDNIDEVLHSFRFR